MYFVIGIIEHFCPLVVLLTVHSLREASHQRVALKDLQLQPGGRIELRDGFREVIASIGALHERSD